MHAEPTSAPVTQEGSSTGQPAAKMVGKSASWLVEVTSAKQGPAPDLGTTRALAHATAFLVDLDVEYLGAAGDIQPPVVQMQSGSGLVTSTTITLSGGTRQQQADIGDWLIFATKYSLHTKERFRVTYVFGVPSDFTGAKLIFGDVPAISLRISEK